jgi:hypothetical protein
MTVVGEASLAFRVSLPETKSGLGIGAAGVSRYQHVLDYVRKYSSGIGIERVGAAYGVRASIVAGTPLDVDLANDLTSVLDGSAVTLPIIMGLFIVNLSDTPGEHLLLGQGGIDYEDWILTAEDAMRVGAGGLHVHWDPIDGMPTNGDTSDILRIAAATGTIEVDLLVVGRLQ